MDYFIYTNKELFIGKIKIPEKGYCKVLKYLDTETINFPFALKVKLIIFRYPKIWAHYSLITMCLNIGTSKTINFPSGTNGKLMVLGVQYLSTLGNVMIIWGFLVFVMVLIKTKARISQAFLQII